MELIKKNIHMDRVKRSTVIQFTMEEDLNLPEDKPDISTLNLEKGEVVIEEIRPGTDEVTVRGKLGYAILYHTQETGSNLVLLSGALPFEEKIHMEGTLPSDTVAVNGTVEDFTVNMINSRKLNVKALVTLKLQAETLFDAEAAEDARFDGDVETLKKTIAVAALSARRKDTFRVREVLSLSGNKPDIDTLLWQDIRLRGVNTRPLDGRIRLDGELMVFAIYSGEAGQVPVQCLEETVPFSGEVELEPSVEEMIPFITVRLVHKELEVNPDSDGEMRELSVDAVMELDMRLYEEKELEILNDLYALDRELDLDTGEACFDQIAARNQLKTRLQEKVDLPVGQRILQICHSDGDVKLDEVQIRDGELSMDGVLEVQLLYLTADDSSPVGASTEVLPFHMTAQVPGITEDSVYQMEPGLEQISAVMLGGDSVEIKASVTMDVLVLNQVCGQVILNVREEPLDTERLKQIPGIVGYVVQPGDSLWKIARKFHTSVDAVMADNGLTDPSIQPGDKLIIVKAVGERA